MLLIAAVAFSTLAIFMKVAFAAGVNPTTLLAYRFLFSATFCFVALKATGKDLSLPREMRWRILLLGGVLHVAVSSFYALSVHRLPAALTGLIFYLYPALVTLFAAIIGRERINRPKMVALAVCFSGLLLVMGVSFAEVSSSGLLFGVLAALTQALHVLFSDRIIVDLSPLLTIGWSALATSAAFFIQGVASDQLIWQISWTGWAAIFGTGFFANFIGIGCFFHGMQQVGPSDASIVMNLEPVLTVVLSVMLLNETFGLMQALGGGLILLGIVWLNRKESLA